MKKMITIFLLTSSLFIGLNEGQAEGNKSIKGGKKTHYVTCSEQTDQMKNLLDAPSFLIEDTKVDVSFSINEYNVITVNEVNTTNPELKKIIQRSLNGQQIQGNNVEVLNQTFTVIFKMEKEKVYFMY